MRKKLAALTFILFFSFTSNSQIDSLFGNVKMLKEELIYLDKSKIPESDYRNSLYSTEFGLTSMQIHNYKNYFQKNWFHTEYARYRKYKKLFVKSGKLKKQTWYEHDNEQIRDYEYFYNKKQNLTLVTRQFHDYPKLITHLSYKNDSLTSSISYSKDPLEYDEFSFKKWERDSSNNTIKTTFFSFNGNKTTKRYTYNKRKQLTSISTNYNKEQSTSTTHALEKQIDYDEFGNITLIRKYNIDETRNLSRINFLISFKYNKKKQLIQKKYHYKNLDNITASHSYKYLDNNLKLENKYNVIDNTNTSKEFYYDKNGYIIKTIIFKKKKKYVIDFKYKFDKKSNWIEIIKSINKKPTFKLKRKISYY